MSRWLRALAIRSALLSIGSVTAAPATVLDVPSEYPTVEAAVEAAASGDSIRIAPGTYEVDIPIVDHAITFLAQGTDETILTGGGQHRVFTDITADVTLIGLTFESAGSPDNIAPASYEGGAMRTSASTHVVIEDCVFRNNKAGRGAAVMSYGDLTIRRSHFENNSNGHEFPVTGIYGGGVLAWYETVLVVEDTVFRNNRAAGGAGIAALGSLIARDCEFDGNFGHHDGGGIWMAGSIGVQTALVEDCIFTDNWGAEGAGLHLGTTGEMVVRRCEFTDNRGGQNGGGIHAGKDGPLLVEDCVFTRNSAIAQGGGGIYVSNLSLGATIRRCLFRGNEILEIRPGNGGAALWLIENSNNADILVEDCTFVDNAATRGSVAAIEDTGIGPFHPRFERCIMAFNAGEVFWCTVFTPKGNPKATIFTDCTVAFGNSPNDEICGNTGPDFVHLGPDDTDVFCDGTYTAICDDSVASTRACGAMGGLPTCGSCASPTRSVSWGRVKSIFHGPARAPGAETRSKRQ